MTGSLQLRKYLDARATMDRAEAADLAGIGIEEARLTDIANEKGEIDLPPWPLNHNQPEEPVMAEGTIAADELRLLIERVERLEEEKKAIADDVKDVYAEAKARGYDTRTMRECVKLRKLETNERQEREALLETYKAALGMDYAETPLGGAAMRHAVDQFERSTAGTPVTMSVNGGPEVPINQAARDADQLYTRAVGLVLEQRNASTSWLQRTLGVGYNQAAGLIERMERAGVVSVPDNDGKRSVLNQSAAA